MDRKVLFIGLDGASWNVMQPLIERGELPNLRHLMETGASGELIAFEPLLSPLIWTTIVTGVMPERHGITSFLSTSDQVEVATLWDIVEGNGGSVGLLGMFPTWPPRATNGFIIPDWAARNAETYPPQLRFVKELEMGQKHGRKISFTEYVKLAIKAMKHGVPLWTILDGAWLWAYERTLSPSYLDLCYRKRILKLRLQAHIFAALTNEYQPTFSAVLFDAIDSISHRYWKFMEPQGFPGVAQEHIQRWGHVIEDCYKEVDKAIGEVLAVLRDDITVIVVSDHGFQADLAAAREEPTIKIESLLDKLRLREIAEGYNLAASYAHIIAKRERGTRGAYVERICENVQKVTVGEDGEKLFDIVSRRDYDIGIALKPGLPLSPDTSLCLPDSTCKAGEILEFKNSDHCGRHKREGIVILKGPGVRRGYKLPSASVLDIAPTTLYALGLPVAQEMEGAVLIRAFEEEYAREHPVCYVPTYGKDYVSPLSVWTPEEEEGLKERLRELGYLS